MAATLLRRSVTTAAVAAVTTVVAPLAVSLLAPTPAVAASAPAIDNTKSAPEPNGSLTQTGEDIRATFDQAICPDATKCSFVLYEINADGSRGLQLPGKTTITTSSSMPVGGTNDTIDFNPQFDLAAGGTYEALVHVTSASTPTTTTDLDYRVYVTTSTNSVPTQLSAPPFANTANQSAFPLSGVAPAGLTVTVNVVDPTDQTGHLRTATASTLVAACSTTPTCPWTAKVDVSKFTSPQDTVDWTASAQDAYGNPTSPTAADAAKQTPKATFGIDYTAPAVPTSNPAPKLTQDPAAHTASVSVNAQDTSSDVTSYLVTITDAAGNKVNPSFPSQGTNLPPTSIDVSGLADGQLTVLIQAVDSHGNVSDSSCQTLPPNSPCSSYSGSGLVKNTGLVPSLDTSLLSSDSGDTTFTNAETASVQSPTKVTVGFTQPIKLSYTDMTTNPPTGTTHNSAVCIETMNLNCIASGTPTLASDSMSLSIKIGSKIPDGKYVVAVTTYSANNCPNKTLQNQSGYTCDQYNDLVRIPGSGTPGTPFTFTVDSTPPTVAVSSITNPITAANENGVTASGTTSKGVASVQVLYTSSGASPSKLLVNASVTQPSDPNATTASWTAGPSNLSSFPDGKVTVKVTAKKSDGLEASVTKTVTMKAHNTTLSEFTDHAVVTANHAIHITGHLSDESGNPIANASISVRPRFSNGKLGHAATAVTNGSGGYSATFVPTKSARYIASYAGSPQHDSARASSARTNVRAAVSLSGKARQSSPVTVTGHVSPNKSGKTVTIFKKTSSGWVVAGKARLNSKSRFTAHLSLGRGKNRLYAAIGQTSGNLAGKSAVLVINVG